MDIQNLEMPLVLFKDAADRVFDHANGIDVIDAVMRRYSDYAYLIRDIQAVRNVEMLEELKETYTDHNNERKDEPPRTSAGVEIRIRRTRKKLRNVETYV